METYTFIVEYPDFSKRSQIFITQYCAVNLKESLWIWANNLDIKLYPQKFVKSIQEEVKCSDIFPMPLNNITNGWCRIYFMSSYGLLLNIIKINSFRKEDVVIAKDSQNRLYTFISQYNGGTFIKQYESVTLLKAFMWWIENMESQFYPHLERIKLKELIVEKSLHPIPLTEFEGIWFFKYHLCKNYPLNLYILDTVSKQEMYPSEWD